jgi:hypothetical protein
MTRAEHIRWCKERAREYLNAGDLQQAIASMMSDLGKHEDTANLASLPLGLFELMKPGGPTVQGTRAYIEGFTE